MTNLVTDVANQALDAAGIDFTLGDIEEGTRPAQVLLRAYGQCRKQLLRAAHWNFSRKQAPMVLLADSTGQTPDVGSLVPDPWRFEYEYPIDCLKARFVPWNNLVQGTGVPTNNIQPANPSAPLMGGSGQQPPNRWRLQPAPFLEATDFNYPPTSGQITWQVQGVSPQGRTVILTNVQQAELVYTSDMLYPSVWDPQFRAALVAYIASEVALPLAKDKKFGMQMRAENIRIAQQKITAARISDGNEGHYSSDISVDWMQARNSGGAWNDGTAGGWSGPGVLGYGWDTAGFSNGSAY